MDEYKCLKTFEKQFMSFCHGYNHADVFCDIVDLSIAFFQFYGDKEVGDYLKKKYGKDYEKLCFVFNEMVFAYKEGINRGNWYDGFGLFYENISSSYKSSRLGQYFTPKPICDLMAEISIGKKKNARVLDNACGSGRMLLAANNIILGNTYFANDIDPICSKMTAINMCIHGLRGQAVCANGLWYGDSWRFGFAVNENLKFGFPSIRKITQGECFQSLSLESMRKEPEKEAVEIIIKKPTKKELRELQMSLF
jgi:type I restriction enzyme M protein